MVLDPRHPSFELTDQNPMADDRGMAFDNGPSQRADLGADFLEVPVQAPLNCLKAPVNRTEPVVVADHRIRHFRQQRVNRRDIDPVAFAQPTRFSTNSVTTAGSAKVDVSPRLSVSFAAIFRRIRRMILPLRVLGSPGAH